MKVFLTGATGYIGSAVTERLRAAGHEVSALARSDASAGKLAATGIRAVRGDFSDPRSITAAAREADGVISLATTYDPSIDGPAIDTILDALSGSNKPFIYTSGIWSHGDTGGSVVIRPAIVYGRGGGIPAGFVESAQKEGAARYVGTGENRWPFVHVDDLAELYLLALEKAPPGTLLLGVSGPSFRVAEVAAAASRGAGAGGKTTAWPLEQARGQLGPSADAMVLDQQASGKKAETLLGWRPSRPNVLEDLEHGSY